MRKINVTSLIIPIIVLAMLSSSCGKLSSASQALFPSPGSLISTPPNGNDCIPPVSNIGVIPVGVDVPKHDIKEIPPSSWEEVGSLPGSAYLYSFTVDNDNEIWVSYSDPTDQLLRYNIKDGEKKFYSTNNNSIVLPAELFLSKDGTLWSRNYIGQSSPAGVPLLSRYDKSDDQFKSVADIQGILQSPRELRSHIVEDDKGLFWMFLKGSTDYSPGALSLYSFDPITLKIEKHPLQVTTNFAFVAIGSDGESIWTSDQAQGHLLQYFPSTQEIHPFDSLPSRDPDEPSIDLTEVLKQPLYLFYDHSGRLWLDNQGWLDLTNPNHPGYYKLIPSPVFIGYFETPQPSYGFLDTFGIFESSDGLVWFTTNGGVARLDIRQGYERGEWCLVTNGYSAVEEDNQQNLWMIVFNKIYTHHIQP